MFLLAQIWFALQPMPVSSITVARLASISPLWTFGPDSTYILSVIQTTKKSGSISS